MYKLGLFLSVIGISFWSLRLIDFATGGHYKQIFSFFESTDARLTLIPSAANFGFGLMLWVLKSKKFSWISILLLAGNFMCGLIGVIASVRFEMKQSTGGFVSLITAPLIYSVGSLFIVISIYYNDSIAERTKRYNKEIKYIGLLTYPLYLVHSELGWWIMRQSYVFGPWLALCIGVAGSFAAAIMVKQIEPYVRRALTNALHRRNLKMPQISDLP